MKKIKNMFLTIFSILVMSLVLEDFIFLFKFNHHLDFEFINLFLNYKPFVIYNKILISYLLAILVSYLFLIFVLRKSLKIVLFLDIIFLSIFFIDGGMKSFLKGIEYYRYVVQINNIRLYDDKNITFKCSKSRFIAHAGGEINGDIYTDSLEALENSYKKGIRYFELDIRKTKDNQYVAVHKWEEWKKFTKYEKNEIPTLKEFLSYKILGKYTPLDIKKINNWFRMHKDAYLVTDKINNPIQFANIFIDKNRLIMELFTLEAVMKSLKEKIIFMPNWMIVREFKFPIKVLKKLNIQYITISVKDFKMNINLIKKIAQNGIKIYIYGDYNQMVYPLYYYGRYVDNIKFCKEEK